MFHSGKASISLRGIHLDLKGLPPTEERLFELLEILSLSRINCLLVEWEDMYPWRKYPRLRNETAYSVKTVESFIEKAESFAIQIIPLVQCLGHMETVLSLERFSGLREDPANVSELCPSKEESHELINDLIDDILSTHGGKIKFFHLGGDEAFIMGSCDRCRKTVGDKGRSFLYLQHVLPIIKHLSGKGIQPILWHDMMIDWCLEDLETLSGKADLMAWNYTSHVKERLEKPLTMFKKAGVDVWGASAFKGADGRIADMPDVENRASNIGEWMGIHHGKGLKGIVATGWSRFNSFFSPCESIESALHTLVISAAAMWDGNLEPGYAEQAMDFLKRGKASKFAGAGFEACFNASFDLHKWTLKMKDLLFNSGARAAHISGETERKNPHEDAVVVNILKDALKEGRHLLENWEQAHRGLVADKWLKHYTESRYRHIEWYAETLIKKLVNSQ